MFRAARTDDSGHFRYVLDSLRVDSEIAVPWRAGDQRLGLVGGSHSCGLGPPEARQVDPHGRPAPGFALQPDEAAGRVVQLYEAWGKKDKAAEWRRKLANSTDEVKPRP